MGEVRLHFELVGFRFHRQTGCYLNPTVGECGVWLWSMYGVVLRKKYSFNLPTLGLARSDGETTEESEYENFTLHMHIPYLYIHIIISWILNKNLNS